MIAHVSYFQPITAYSAVRQVRQESSQQFTRALGYTAMVFAVGFLFGTVTRR